MSVSCGVLNGIKFHGDTPDSLSSILRADFSIASLVVVHASAATG